MKDLKDVDPIQLAAWAEAGVITHGEYVEEMQRRSPPSPEGKDMSDTPRDIAVRCVPSSGSEYPMTELGRGIAVDHAENVIKDAIDAAIAAEREACAKVADERYRTNLQCVEDAREINADDFHAFVERANVAHDIATAIRSRKS